MDLKKQIGQLFVLGFQGLDPSPEFVEFVREWGIGGVIVFGRNIGDIHRLPVVLDRLSEAAGHAQFRAIDQEGGLVMRILGGGSLFPGAMAMAATGRPELAERVAGAIAREMRALGLTWNLAPVLDINHPHNPGIGARSFGETPEQVIRFGIPFIRGLQQGGVLACAKHFPGLGHARADSHLSLPVIPHSLERLRSFELAPFRAAIEAGVGAIMTAHVVFSALEETAGRPATLSRRILTDLVRGELGFDGLLITDDLEMGAVTGAYGVSDAALQAFLAGADLLLICHDLGRARQAAERLLDEVRGDPEARRRLDKSLERIAAARKRLAATATDGRDTGTGGLSTLVSAHAPLIAESHRLAILVAHRRLGSLPLPADRPIFAFFPRLASLVQIEEVPQEEGFRAIVQNTFQKATIALFGPTDTADRIIESFDSLAACMPSDTPLVIFTYNAHLFAGQAEATRRLLACRPGAIVVALRDPYDLSLFPEAGAGIATFGFRTPALRAVLDVLAGRATPGAGPWPIG